MLWRFCAKHGAKVINMLKKIVISCCFIVGLGACVTTTNRGPVDLQSAHDTRVELGMNYLGVGLRDNARFQFSEALKIKRNSAEAYHGIGLVHQANGEMEPAGDAFRRALRFSDSSNRSAISMSYGTYLMEQGNPGDACAHFEAAAADFDYGRRPQALYRAAQCAQLVGNTPRVKPAYQHALNLNQNFAPALIELAEIHYREENYPEAKRLLDRYHSVVESSARSLWLGIRIERIFGNRDREASYALALRNKHPYSNEFLEYRRLSDANR